MRHFLYELFYNKTSRSNNIVLSVLCRLCSNKIQKLRSVHHLFPGHSSCVHVKRAAMFPFANFNVRPDDDDDDDVRF